MFSKEQTTSIYVKLQLLPLSQEALSSLYITLKPGFKPWVRPCVRFVLNQINTVSMCSMHACIYTSNYTIYRNVAMYIESDEALFIYILMLCNAHLLLSYSSYAPFIWNDFYTTKRDSHLLPLQMLLSKSLLFVGYSIINLLHIYSIYQAQASHDQLSLLANHYLHTIWTRVINYILVPSTSVVMFQVIHT